MNITYDQILKKFRYPESIVSENDSWYTLLRMEQLTFGSLILITNDSKNLNFSTLDEKEQLDMFKAIKKIEEVGYQELNCEKINYLGLMMLDPIVHFHILPRYSQEKIHNNLPFSDPGFPGPPNLEYKTNLESKEYLELVEYVIKLFT